MTSVFGELVRWELLYESVRDNESSQACSTLAIFLDPEEMKFVGHFLVTLPAVGSFFEFSA